MSDNLREHTDGTADFLDGFAQAPEEADAVPSRRALLLTSAGMTLAGALGALGFVLGAMWASLHEPDLQYGNLAAELGIKIGYALFVGALAGAVVVALVIAVVGAVVLRERRRAATRPSPSPSPPRPAGVRHERAH